ncbi:MAG: family 10 glycosylhydrolase [Clostridia bacterium]|nr:family 10 glycosylhydrolase [Clostridia bacterium]
MSDSTDSTVSSGGSNSEVTTTATTTVTTATSKSAFTADPTQEMRAAWVSYIELDTIFTSCKTETQVREKLNGILDTFQQFRLNTMYLHVRANSDAYYVSSYFLPATNAKKFIEAGFDPLAYMVREAHRRNIAVHAWVNPYRIGRNTAFAVADTPTFSDSNGRYYYVPSSATSQRLILNGIRELVNNYAIDGVQYDDYFYPTGVLETNTVYGYESADYAIYQQSGGTLAIADWRRAAVDSLISATYTIVKSKNMTFGVSPAVSADATYKNLYANPKKWLAESGYVDYICPQVYTGFEHGSNPFSKAVEQWLSYPRHSSVKLYIGVASYKAGLLNDTYAKGGATEWAQNNDILKRSILEIRNRKIPGFALYSYSYLTPDKVVGLSKTNDVSVAKTEMQNLLTVL